MLLLRFLFGLAPRGATVSELARQRVARRIQIEALLRDIAERDGSRPTA
ncbi:hypothetical protein [Enterovirga sp.]|jgi:hypothetical protein|nr:hypothetical protein [Enterovirga sp.]MDB5591581.1 hypothetical protein [Enterovirga sp.]